MSDYKFYYERHLPHIQPPAATLFLTYRLAGSIPASMLIELTAEADRISTVVDQIGDQKERTERIYLEQRRIFGKWDDVLDKAETRPLWLQDDRLAKIIAKSLHYLDEKRIVLDTYCIMANHVHAIFTPLFDKTTEAYFPMFRIMQSHKRFTSRHCNLIPGRKGQFWQHESYDHYVRDEAELERIRRYVLNNPVSAGLVDEWDQWRWSYCKYY
ncbi:MAG: transposase [Candidatus Promineifilaceae bacterium]|nr:transposase [Candidatus Promineifilaceae bacterium]